jgi:hypothetical protein
VGLINDWNERPIETEATSGGTVLIADVVDALMRPIAGIWPPPALVMQLGDGESRRYPFGDELREQVSRRLGHYCALQSINSEDALTWNFFGTLMYGPEEHRVGALNWMCELLDLPPEWQANTRCAIDLWRRIPHPYYPGTDGPELDAVLAGDRCVVFVEAKWLSPEGIGRGPDGSQVGQMHLRQHFFEKWGAGIYGDIGKLVLGVGLTGQMTPDAGPGESAVAVRSLTWAQLSGYDGHPNGDEFARYLAWKTENAPEAQRRLSVAARLGRADAVAESAVPAAVADGCVICGADKHPQAYACARCKRILDRLETRKNAGVARKYDREARIRAMQQAWRDGAFRCHYTGVVLIDDPARWRDHRYFAFEHQTPGDETSVVVTCALVNRMKTDLTDIEFRVMVSELAKVFTGGSFDEEVFPEGNLPSA